MSNLDGFTITPVERAPDRPRPGCKSEAIEIAQAAIRHGCIRVEYPARVNGRGLDRRVRQMAAAFGHGVSIQDHGSSTFYITAHTKGTA
jgi:hypothetical protein